MTDVADNIAVEEKKGLTENVNPATTVSDTYYSRHCSPCGISGIMWLGMIFVLAIGCYVTISGGTSMFGTILILMSVMFLLSGIGMSYTEIRDLGDSIELSMGPSWSNYLWCGMANKILKYSDIRKYETTRICGYGIGARRCDGIHRMAYVYIYTRIDIFIYVFCAYIVNLYIVCTYIYRTWSLDCKHKLIQISFDEVIYCCQPFNSVIISTEDSDGVLLLLKTKTENTQTDATSAV